MEKSIYEYFNDKKILIVDDNDYIIEMLNEFLEQYFFEIIVAKDGFECIDYLEYYKPDLVLTDIEMPNFNGLQAIEKIRETNFNIPIIIMSAHDDKEFLHLATNLDVQGYIFKPLDIEVLFDALKKLIKHKKKTDLIKIDENIIFDHNNSMIILSNQSVSLTLREKELLNLFIENKDKIVTYETIESRIWDKYDESMSISSLRTLIKQLRLKMGKDLIKNISKVGYKFTIE